MTGQKESSVHVWAAFKFILLQGDNKVVLEVNRKALQLIRQVLWANQRGTKGYARARQSQNLKH